MPNWRKSCQGSFINANGVRVCGAANAVHSLKIAQETFDSCMTKTKNAAPLALGIAVCGCTIGVAGKLLWDKIQSRKAEEQLALQQEPKALPEERTEYLEENQF